MSTREARFRAWIEGNEEVAAFFAKGSDAARRFASTVRNDLAGVGRDLTSTAAGFARLTANLANVGTSLSLASNVRSVIELRDAVNGVAATAGLADDKIAGLRKQLLDTGVATNQFASDMTGALNAFVAKTGDIEAGRQNLELYGRTARAARASVSDIANIGAELHKLDVTDQAKALAVLTKQSDVGSVELKDLVSQGPRLISAFQAAGLHGEQGLREGGALAQVAQSSTGNVERTSTAVEAAFRDIVNKAPELKQAGINVFDPVTHKMNDLVQVLLQIVEKSKGRQDYLQGRNGVFGDEAMRAVNPLAAEYRATGGFATFEKFRDVNADSSIIDRKFQLNSQTTAARLRQVQIEAERSTDSNVGDKIDDAGKYASKLSGAYGFALEHPLLTAGGLLGGKAALRYGGRKAGDLLGGLAGGGGQGGGLEGVLSGATGTGSPVFVTNWPVGLAGGGGAVPSVGGGAGAAGPGVISKLGAAGAGLGAGIAIGSTLNDLYFDEAHTKMQSEISRETFIGTQLENTPEAKVRHQATMMSNLALRNVASGGTLSNDEMAAARLATQRLLMQDPSLVAGTRAGGAVYAQLRTEGRNEGEAMRIAQVVGAELGRVRSAVIDKAPRGDAPTLQRSGVGGGEVSGTPGLLRRPAPDGDSVDIAEQLRANLGLNFTIHIAGEQATVDGDTGTRSPSIMVRRGG